MPALGENKFPHGAYLIPEPGPQPLSAYIYFDAVMTETVTRTAEVSEYSVETGSNVTDNYRIGLTSIRLECLMTQEPIDEQTHPEGGQATFAYQNLYWGPYPTPSTLAAVVGAITNPVGSVLKLFNPDPASVSQPLLSWPIAFNSVTALLNRLEDLRTNATLVDVVTPNWTYYRFLVGEIETVRDNTTGGGARISIELHQVNQVNTEAADVPAIPAKKEDTKSVNKGPQQPSPAPVTQQSTSFLSQGATALIPKFGL